MVETQMSTWRLGYSCPGNQKGSWQFPVSSPQPIYSKELDQPSFKHGIAYSPTGLTVELDPQVSCIHMLGDLEEAA